MHFFFSPKCLQLLHKVAGLPESSCLPREENTPWTWAPPELPACCWTSPLQAEPRWSERCSSDWRRASRPKAPTDGGWDENVTSGCLFIAVKKTRTPPVFNSKCFVSEGSTGRLKGCWLMGLQNLSLRAFYSLKFLILLLTVTRSDLWEVSPKNPSCASVHL